jgi:hypothetical protein
MAVEGREWRMDEIARRMVSDLVCLSLVAGANTLKLIGVCICFELL